MLIMFVWLRLGWTVPWEPLRFFVIRSKFFVGIEMILHLQNVMDYIIFWHVNQKYNWWSSASYKELKLISLIDQRKLRDIMFLCGVFNNLNSFELVNMFSHVPSFCMRKKSLFQIYKTGVNYYLNSLLLRCSKTYNNYSNLVNVDHFFDSRLSFSNELKRFLLILVDLCGFKFRLELVVKIFVLIFLFL